MSANLGEKEAEVAAQALLEEASVKGSNQLYTEYESSTTPVSAHFSWIPTYDNDIVKNWLLSNEITQIRINFEFSA